MKIRCYGCGQKLDVSEVEPLTPIDCPVCHTRLIVPKRFGELLLEEDLGSGTLANVFRSMDITLDREIAVKVLKDAYRHQETVNQAFINQARIVSAINHPHSIPIYSCGETEGRAYIVMQYMAGGSLASRLAGGGRPPLQDALRWWMDAIKGLESAQVHGILHGDVKPSNILLDLDGNAKVADFGLSRIVYPDEPLDYHREDFDLPLVRSWYVSPERISSGIQDVQGDIYGLGATFYHLLTGQPPFDSDNARENVRRRFQAIPKPPRELNEALPEGLSDLLQAMLNVYPSDRPESYATVARHVSKYLETPAGKPAASARPARKRIAVPASAGEAAASPAPAAPLAEALAEVDAFRPRAGALVWLCRIVFTLLAATFITLGLAHAVRAQWYTTHVLPHLPAVESPSPPAAPSS